MAARKQAVLGAAFLSALLATAAVEFRGTAQMAGPPASANGAVHLRLGAFGPAEAGDLFPASVYFQGKTAPVQARNSAGVRFSPDAEMLAALVDSSGYSSQVQEKYQAYLITEVPLRFGDKTLPAGAYGCGFVANNTFLVMDLGGRTVLTATTLHDAAIRRPTPLQILPDSGIGAASTSAPELKSSRYRLYEGRTYTVFQAAP